MCGCWYVTVPKTGALDLIDFISQVFFGTPFDVNRDEWIDILFNITLASTEREPFVGERRELLTNVIQTGPEALMAASSRFKSLINQYQIMSIYETRSTPFVGIVVRKLANSIPIACTDLQASYRKTARRSTFPGFAVPMNRMIQTI